MMSSGAHVIIELLHLPNAYGALGPYIKDGVGTFPSIASSSLSRRTNQFYLYQSFNMTNPSNQDPR